MHPDDKLITACLLIFILLGTGTIAYHQLENWSYVDSLYFTSMTVTTVGYGDFVPSTDMSKLFTVFFSFAGISIALVILVTIGGEYYTKERRMVSYKLKTYLDSRKKQKTIAKRKRTMEAKRQRLQLSKRQRLSRWIKRKRKK
ncbi:two pore domain potassium channel family protein [Candidatus Woesearchaeota archaeon]|jgi:voltage-gated potassium channel|nr:two pore domain potassium channel family protein [Candidatus Woesearchaeota archaeon]MBT7062651.1 two pore domain potassium channel family protein [Candidatus Woesearchaeota archaeon]MBT7403126.1 two pore domain potassium channel family protein [Candidatus Woesearchaeota archaeon]